MRMLALVTDAFGGSGGIAQYNRNFLRACASFEGIDQILVLPRDSNHDGETGTQKIKNIQCPKSKISYVSRAIALAIRSKPIDIVFCGHENLCTLSYLITRLTSAQLWLQIHGIEAWERPKRLTRWAVERADLVTSVSRYSRRRLLLWAKLSPSKVRVLPNTVSERFKPGPKPSYLIDRYGLAGKKILLTVSRLSANEQYKGHDKVIEALPRLVEQHPELVYLIVGEGDDQTRLESMVEQLGVQNSVLFLGKISDHELPDLYRTADIFIMPSTGEGFGIVFLEAQASGMLVVASPEGGAADALQDRKSGHLIANAALEEKLLELLDKKYLTTQNEARATQVRTIFGKEKFEKHVHEIAGSVLTCRPNVMGFGIG